VKKFINKLRTLFKSPSAPPRVSDILERYLHNKSAASFVQIGSNDGVSNDVLRPFILSGQLHGVLIEPVKYLFEKLKANYPDHLLIEFENVAIASEEGFRDFYRLRQEEGANLPEWYEQLGSFRKDVVLKHKEQIPDIEKYLITDQVECITFASLLKRHQLDRIDILQIDTEGYDFEIIKMIDWPSVQVDMIIYEHKHLSASDQQACMALLTRHGFKCQVVGNDTVATHRHAS